MPDKCLGRTTGILHVSKEMPQHERPQEVCYGEQVAYRQLIPILPRSPVTTSSSSSLLHHDNNSKCYNINNTICQF